jgi:hypothetical protein
MLADPSILRRRGQPDPTDFVYRMCLFIMIEPIEDAFGTHDQKDRQDKANEASACGGIGLAEAQEEHIFAWVSWHHGSFS